MYLRLENLSAGYGGKPIVEDINVAVPKGKILTMIGPNGSGKTTLLKSITKQLKIMGGAVYVGGGSLEEMSARSLSRRMAAVFTKRPKPELMTCGDVVAVGRYPYTRTLGILSANDHAKIDEALLLVDALELKNRSFSEISDGQLQRVMLARAICQEPEIIVLDEPTSFLDIRYALEILDILRRMADEKGVSVVMSLHELSYAKRVSDFVMCVKNGRVPYLDTPEKIFTEEIISELYELPKGAYDELFGRL
jgi:iron complex transport system ATP-binding protein